MQVSPGPCRRKIPGQRYRLIASAKLGSLQLGDAQGEPLHAQVAEVHLHAGLAALAFGIDDDAGAEFRMHYVLADAKATGVARFLEHGLLLFCRSPDEFLPSGKARCEPLHEPLGDLLEEARRDVVARLAVQQAGLRVREVQAMARARDRDVGQAALLFQAVALDAAPLWREQALLRPRK